MTTPVPPWVSAASAAWARQQLARPRHGRYVAGVCGALGRATNTDPVLWRIAEIVHVADLDDDRFDAPEAPGLDVLLRGLSMTGTDEQTLAVSAALFDGLYEYHRRRLLLGREPA